MSKDIPPVIIDVRERDEFAQADKMSEAVNIPMGQMFLEVAKDSLPRDRRIVTVCKSGVRCRIVSEELRQRGYDIDYLEGGMDAWKMSL